MKRVLRCLPAALDVHAGESASEASSLVPVADRRGAEQTLLTYPEWFLMHSSAEYARMMQSRPSHKFPFVSHIGQLWTSYADVAREQWRADYPFNPGYHVIIGVIATSTTVEYGMRAVYGNTVGRISWALGGSRATDEDRFDAQTAQQYVDFIRQEPCYLFDFGLRLKTLWTGVPMQGHGLVRKWERCVALTSEYGAKAAYAKIIEVATHAAYSASRITTDVVVDDLPEDWTAPAEVKLLRRFDDGRALLALPRRGDSACEARSAHHRYRGEWFEHSRVVWVPEGHTVDAEDCRILFTQPVETPAHTTRVVMLVPIKGLSALLAGAEDKQWTVKHVYDY
ncbi:hypothetical protein BUMB_03338c [Candidatus Paraburkholderia calva]|nr:hypothetical protein BUMB_03338c [Candidatus Paraburkholderia calva]